MATYIDNIAIPIDMDTFVAPDLRKILDYYRSYKSLGGTLQLGGYLCTVLNEIDKARPNEYDGDKALQEFIRHVGGVDAFMQIYERCK